MASPKRQSQSPLTRQPQSPLTLPLCNDAGTLFEGKSSLPLKRVAARMYLMSSQSRSDPSALETLLREASCHGLTWSHPAARSGSGCTPLHIACALGRPMLVRLFIHYSQAGVDSVDVQDTFGNTALLVAACRGKHGCIKALLEAEANPNLSNHRGYTPLNAAVDAAHSECAALLTAFGAAPPAPQTPGKLKREVQRSGGVFHWERGLAQQRWWSEAGLPRQSRRAMELQEQISRHMMASVPDAHLLETPLERFAIAERRHAKQHASDARRKHEKVELEAERGRRLDAYYARQAQQTAGKTEAWAQSF